MILKQLKTCYFDENEKLKNLLLLFSLDKKKKKERKRL